MNHLHKRRNKWWKNRINKVKEKKEKEVGKTMLKALWYPKPDNKRKSKRKKNNLMISHSMKMKAISSWQSSRG